MTGPPKQEFMRSRPALKFFDIPKVFLGNYATFPDIFYRSPQSFFKTGTAFCDHRGTSWKFSGLCDISKTSGIFRDTVSQFWFFEVFLRKTVFRVLRMTSLVTLGPVGLTKVQCGMTACRHVCNYLNDKISEPKQLIVYQKPWMRVTVNLEAELLYLGHVGLIHEIPTGDSDKVYTTDANIGDVDITPAVLERHEYKNWRSVILSRLTSFVQYFRKNC